MRKNEIENKKWKENKVWDENEEKMIGIKNGKRGMKDYIGKIV